MSSHGWLDDHCEFGEDRVYLLMLIARTKENDDLDDDIVFREVVKEEIDIDRKVKKLRAVAEGYDKTWRLYVSANARNTYDGYRNFRETMNGWVGRKLTGEGHIDEKFKRVGNNWMSELQKPGAKDDSYFVFDLDTREEERFDGLMERLSELTEIRVVLDTPNGYHVMTRAFNYTEMEIPEKCELKKDAMVHVDRIGGADE